MEVIYPRRAGLDVHKKTVVTCVQIVGDEPPLQEVRSFEATTSGLLGLADWLDSFDVEHVAGHRRVLKAGVARARSPLRARAGQRRARQERPGRETDVNDAMWLADLLAHGLICASFVPPVAVQELHSLMGTSGRAVLHALVAGETDPRRLASHVSANRTKRSSHSKSRAAV